jgi:hypothetical protein
MNKTKQLMAAITASLFVAGPVSGLGMPTASFQQETKQPDESKKSDPGLQKNCDDIERWLRTQSRTVDEVARQFPNMTHPQVEEALENLRQDDRIRRSGLGTKDSPYQYYVPRHSGG